MCHQPGDSDGVVRNVAIRQPSRYNVDQPAAEITNAPTVLQHRDSLPRSWRQERVLLK